MRLPQAGLDPATAARYCVGDAARSWATRTHVIAGLHSEDTDGAVPKELTPEEVEEMEHDEIRRSIISAERLAVLELRDRGEITVEKEWGRRRLQFPIRDFSEGVYHILRFKLETSQLSELERFFHYRNVDVSTLKELARRWQPEVLKSFEKKSRHEALADIYESIAELQHYRVHLFVR